MTAIQDRAAVVDTPRYDPALRYTPGATPVLLTGVQAVARMLVESASRESAAGRHTEFLVSGYPGSPLGGLDKLLHGLPELRENYGVRLVPGVNEELGATAVWGSQQIPGTRRTDGVVGVWYGKGPGLDRSGDAIRHGNLYGASPDGGVLVLVGDDPAAKSSSVPCASERSLASYGMPVVTPRNATELISLGLYSIAMSRLTGCWVGMTIDADVADGLWTVDTNFTRLPLVIPQLEWNGRPWTYTQRAFLAPPDCLVSETDLVGPRWAAVEAFRDANPLNTVEVNPREAWLGIVSTGTSYDATRQALLDLGLDDAALEARGIRLLRIGMPYPLGERPIRTFAADLDEIVVIEDKASFIESQLKEALYGMPGAPRVHGKRTADGAAFVPADGQLTADRLERVFRTLLRDRVELTAPRERARTQLSLTPVKRTPYFCSGCPHNRSTVVPEGSLAGGGIGCHAMVSMHERPAAQVLSLTQMGGEGSQWIGQAPFTDVPHIFQNIGDGTFFHSGQLALQACVAAGVNITYKLLYNSAVAMTGAQHAEGALSVPALTHKLSAEGVAKTVVVTDEPRKYRRSKRLLAAGVTVRHRDDLDEVQRELREVPGVTVVIYDQQCANEARRLRKRGKQAVRTTRVVIDEQVCEGCGDCGVKSNCLSVQPVDTEFGRKTRIDQTSCNTDYSCLLGDCPSFLTAEVTTTKKTRRAETPTPPTVDEPVRPAHAEIFMTGIGGTGIVTVNQVLATAALRSGLATTGLDQVGLSQKAGPVTSHLLVGRPANANRVGVGAADVLLAFDALVAAEQKNLPLLSAADTVAVVSTSPTPTGTQVADAQAPSADIAAVVTKLQAATHDAVTLDALGAAETLFGSTAPANFLLVGAAYQLGRLPMPATAIEEAVELNGVAVAANIAAFRWGRALVAAPTAFADATGTNPVERAPRTYDLGASPLAGETRRLTAIRAQLLLEHSGTSTARHYIELVERAWMAERALGERSDFSAAVATGLAHLWAYKDEYEVARLLTRPELLDEVRAQVPGATGVKYNLHPPLLRGMGLDSKLHLPLATSRPVLRVLAKGKRLRGTPLDPFARAHVRRVERELAASHTGLVERLIATLTESSYDTAAQAAAAAEIIRGYEHVKLGNVERYHQRLAELGA